MNCKLTCILLLILVIKAGSTIAQQGKWLQENGEAIYETNPVEPFLDGKVAYTAKGSNTVYAIYMPSKDEKELPSEIFVRTKLEGRLSVNLLSSKQHLSFNGSDGGIWVKIPEKIRTTLASHEAIVFRITKK